MKSLIRNVAAGVLAAATMLGIAGLGATTANAEDATGTLTVTSSDAAFNGKKVNAYQMFSATVGGEGANKAVSYTLTDTWKPFFMDSTASGLNGATDANVNDKANEYVSELAGDNLVAFATKASNWAQTQAKNITADKTATVSAGATNGNYTATFTGLDYGYYVVAVPGATLANTSGQYATLVSVDSTNVNANIKGSLPTVDKKVQVNGNGADTADAKIGDTLTFTLTSTIPDMSAYDTYTFNFKDTLSKGLTYGDITSVTVEGVDAPLVKDTDYTVTTTPAAAGNTLLTVGMTDFKNKQQTNAGKKITVTYTATLNENAVVGGAGNVNSATIQYSNDPSSTGTGESEPDKVRVFTYGFTVDKYTGDNYNDAATRLAGAEFTLTAKGDTSAIKFVQVNAGSATEDAVYRVAKAGETAGTTTTITTPANGKVVFQGLKNGEYTLTETKAPAGYNKLASAIGVKVNGSNDGTDTTNATVNITYNNDNNDTTYDQTASNGVIPVQNKSGAILPGTGGMGTIAFTVIGVLVIALGVAWTLKRKNA
ncbi:SpaH/EbpB family LPXTG-anchored major pilin [Bifidobacterium longum]|uniref:Cell surface protein with gram positive anchor n=3 Tax=Bifidobacterium TaxID=1678 RepID=A0A4V2N1T2_BIFLL|nr:SpaH/EbpB family LPXTG-anchored major pilin [Bifidobacterium longum]TCD95158.1 Cell surface protein with gram positive anchor [Bifidobacterium longum subsp. longum]